MEFRQKMKNVSNKMTPSQKKEIEKRFYEKFRRVYLYDHSSKAIGTYTSCEEEIKSFLFSTLDQALAEQREELNDNHLEAMRGLYSWMKQELDLIDKSIEPMKKHLEWFFDLKNGEEIKKRFALSEVQEIISFESPPTRLK